MLHRTTLSITIIAALFALFIIGCDTTADRELHRAQDAMDAAEEIGAEEYATDDFRRAYDYFQEAMDASDRGEIQEARRLAIKAKLGFEDATTKTEERMRTLQSEHERLGR